MEYHNLLKLNPILRYITLILFLASTARAADVLVPSYDDKANKLKFFEARSNDPLLLHCNVTNGNHKLTWQKNGTDVAAVPSLKSRYEIKEKENNFIIRDTNVDDAGNYSCSIPETGDSATIRVVANVYLKKIPDNIAVVEGEKLQIHCKAFGTDPKIVWKIGPAGGDEDFNRTHVTLERDAENIEDAILTIEHVELTDRNTYKCIASNEATDFNDNYKPAEDEAYVRVKGKLAALWPFLGICAEVFVLCAIILVYEKRRNKEGLDESDTDQSPEQEKLKAGK